MSSRFLLFPLVLAACLDGQAAPSKNPRPGRAAAKAKPAAPRPRTSRPAAPRPAPEPARAVDPLAALTPLRSGPGLILGDPVGAEDTAAETLAFGAGCTRWLQLELSDHLDLGKMPRWEQFAQIAPSVRWQDGGMAGAEAARLAKRSGVSHAVVSQIRGDAAGAELRLQLVALPAGARVGAPLVLSGGFKDILAALPGAARGLLADLGASDEGVPAALDVPPNVVIACGRAPLNPALALPPGTRTLLVQQNYSFPLGGLLAWREADGFPPDVQVMYAENAGDSNPLVKLFLAEHRPDKLGRLPARLLDAMQRGTPNYLLSTLQALEATKSKRADVTLRGAERAARSMPGNPRVWLALARAYGDSAEAIRYGRVVGEITETEWDKLNALYERQLAAAARAVSMDASSGEAWLKLSSSATFAGDREVARQAFWRARELAPDDPDVYFWGL